MPYNTDNYYERRKYPRIPAKIKFSCKKTPHISGTLDGHIEIYSKDLSSSGVYLEECPGLNKGYLLDMEFMLPDKKIPIKVKGLIVRKDEYGSGVRFLTLNINEFETMDNYVKENLEPYE